VNHQADEQLEMLDLLCREEPLKQPSDVQHAEVLERQWQNSQGLGRSSEIEIRADPGREQRKGTPEVIFGETKDVAQITAMAQKLLKETGRAIISRVRPEAIAPLQAAFQAYTVSVHEAARSV